MVVLFKARSLIYLPSTFCFLRQPVRNRHVPDPGTLEQRLFRAVTTPVLPPIRIDPVEKRIRREERFRLQRENNPYRAFLRQKAREEFYGLADGRMLLVLFPLYHKPREFLPVRNRLFRKNLVFHSFPVSILREAAANTRWETFANSFLTDNSPNLYLFGDADPGLCGSALNILQKAPFFLLLGGVIEYRILTADQLNEFANYNVTGGLDGARSRLIGVLDEVRGRDLIRNLTAHQTDLVVSLRQHSSVVHDQRPFHFPPTYTLTSRFRWRQSASATEQLVSHEAEAFNVLGRSERVRVCIEPHQPELRRLTGAQPGDSTIDLPSAELKRIIKLLKSSVFMIKTDGDVPVFKLCDHIQNSVRENKTGVKLQQDERGKTLRMNSQIDDHMLEVRVKQAETFLDANYVVAVFIKPRRNKPVDGQTEKWKEQEDLAKTIYKIQAQRFVNAFSQIPFATVRLLERPQLNEIALVVRRTQNS
ncbi:39S ribosomal protein L10 [Fasciolopsis buskii]|uniref:Large ribosomal subunit protein uL10m n=1 Tax=Fasciolopsis buskii TaxID=27845 RepID=A0A8E0S129_9TREM|nr:39S ribosomal protein L10 [Fasciolopsis buski]